VRAAYLKPSHDLFSTRFISDVFARWPALGILEQIDRRSHNIVVFILGNNKVAHALSTASQSIASTASATLAVIVKQLTVVRTSVSLVHLNYMAHILYTTTHLTLGSTPIGKR
jgi:hypothetical protein